MRSSSLQEKQKLELIHLDRECFESTVTVRKIPCRQNGMVEIKQYMRIKWQALPSIMNTWKISCEPKSL